MRLLFRKSTPGVVIAALIALLAGLFLLAGHTILDLGGDGESELFDHWLYDGLMLGAALVCLARVFAVREERAAWALIGTGLLGWALGDIYWTFVLADLGQPPFPSLSDVGYLAFYPLGLAGIGLLIKARFQRVRATMWLDALIAALAVTAIGIEVLLDVVLRYAGVDGLAMATSVAYPMGDILVLSFASALLVITGGMPGRAWGLMVAGLGATALADGVYSYILYTGTYAEGGPIDLLWPIGSILVAAAAWQKPQRERERIPRGWRALAVPAIFTALIAARLGLDPLQAVNPAAQLVVALMLAVILARFILTLGENSSLLDRVETEPLTGLGNRGKLLEDLRSALYARRPHVVAIFDLDGFKLYNDTFGHPAGDALLSRLGRRLASSLPEGGGAYRIGGDEFCVLLPGALQGDSGAVERAAAALTEQGEGFDVTSSFGSVAIPQEATEAGAALQLADKRMYDQKDSRRLSAGGQAKAVLLRALRERQPDLGEHVHGVSELAVAVGKGLGLDRGDLVALSRAAELHDAGKVAIPDAILDKPGPLTDEEWSFMKQHTILGERIISSAPSLAHIAQIVRSSHEHFDGSGYPDGLAGEEIPLASRIVLACDAFNAMTSERPYAAARTRESALRELRRCAGTQFDPRIVEEVCSVLPDEMVAATNGSNGRRVAPMPGPVAPAEAS